MTDEMKEVRKAVSEIDGMASELEFLIREAEDEYSDEGEELTDILNELMEKVTDYQLAKGWI